jgi:hypothetical protein
MNIRDRPHPAGPTHTLGRPDHGTGPPASPSNEVVTMRRSSTAVALAFALAACSSAPNTGIVGEWASTDGKYTLKLLEDGKFEGTGPGGPTHGRYQRAEEGMLRMEFDNISTTAAYSVSDTALVLCPESYPCESFQRDD